MAWRLVYVMTGLFLAIVSKASNLAVAQEKSVEELQFALEATLAWNENVSFKGQFSIFEATLDDLQLADFLGQIESSGDPQSILANEFLKVSSGEIVAFEGLVRLKMAYGGGTELVHAQPDGTVAQSGTTIVRHCPFEQVFGTTPSLGVPYHVFHEIEDTVGLKKFGNVVGVSEAASTGMPVSRIHQIPTPLSLDPLGVTHLFSTNGEISVSTDENTIRIERVKKYDSTTCLRTVVLTTESDYPVVTEVSGRDRIGDGTTSSEFARHFAKFVNVGNGFIAAQIVVSTTRQTASGKNAVQVFHSDDLGDNLVSEVDLEISFPEDATVFGIAELPPAENGKRRLNMLKLLPQDIEAKTVLNPKLKPPIELEAPKKLSAFLLLNSAAIVGLLCFVGLKIWKRAA